MNKKFLTFQLCLLLAACSDTGQSTTELDTNTDTDNLTDDSGSTDDTSTAIENEDLVLPEQLSLVEPKTTGGNQAPAFLAQAPATEGGFLDEGTDYSETSANTYVWLEALEPLETVDSILCFIGQLRPEQEVNEGPYTVLADMDSCFEENGGGDDQSSGSQGAVNYTEVVVDATRDDTDDAPMNVKAWLTMNNGDFTQAIRINGVIREGASEENPFGSFTLSYQFADAIDSADPDAYGKGELATVDTLAGFQGFTLYETSIWGPGEEYETSASVVVNPAEDNGVALTGFRQVGNDEAEANKAFAISYNSDLLLLQKAATFDALPYKNDDQNGTCLSRNEFTESVWRYGLFNVADGSSVELNSGFPFLYDADGDGVYAARGYASYWGIWTEDQGVELSGTTIQRETFDGSTGEEYSLLQAHGRLKKNTVVSLDLDDIGGIEFEFYDWDNETGESSEYIVEYDTELMAFVRTATFEYNDNGQTRTELETPQAIEMESGANLYMYSGQLGGGVQYIEGAEVITFFKQEYVTGNETGTGELFENGTATLYCYERCPKTGLSATDLETWDGPYEADSQDINTPYTYTISNTGDLALELIKAEAVVQYPDVEEDGNNQHSWGFNSGGMVTDTSNLNSVYDIYNPDSVTVFYEFETGPNDWNRQTVLSDAAGTIIAFDKPLEFTYRHEDTNDRSGDAGFFANQTLLLNYGGNGDLWGIPGYEDTDNGFWLPAFSIADAVVMGNSEEYVVKALDIEQTMSEADNCSVLALNDPAAPVPEEVTGDLNNDVMPEVTDAPRYIAGEATSDE